MAAATSDTYERVETTAKTAASMTAPVSSKPRKRIGRTSDTIASWAFISPFLISFVMFFLIPSIVSVYISFHRYRGYGDAQFVGFDNYQAIFQSTTFWQSLRNTLFYWLVPLPFLMVGAFVLALILRSKVIRLGRVYKPLLFIPQMMAPVAAALVWKVLLSQNGAVNQFFGVDIPWLSSAAMGPISVCLLLLWRAVGWYMVIFLSALTSISGDVLEAAQMDGANSFQTTIRVILPMMKPTILFAFVIDTVGALQLFSEPNLLLGGSGNIAGAPPTAAPLMNQVIINVSGGQYGIASAVGWLMFLGIGFFSILQFKLLSERK